MLICLKIAISHAVLSGLLPLSLSCVFFMGGYPCSLVLIDSAVINLQRMFCNTFAALLALSSVLTKGILMNVKIHKVETVSGILYVVRVKARRHMMMQDAHSCAELQAPLLGRKRRRERKMKIMLCTTLKIHYRAVISGCVLSSSRPHRASNYPIVQP